MLSSFLEELPLLPLVFPLLSVFDELPPFEEELVWLLPDVSFLEVDVLLPLSLLPLEVSGVFVVLSSFFFAVSCAASVSFSTASVSAFGFFLMFSSRSLLDVS